MRGPSQGSCFNPTLVRLRPHPLAAAGLAAPGFQSHAGSIEALNQITTDGVHLMFQSHAGSIEADQEDYPNQRGPLVSIPRWFD